MPISPTLPVDGESNWDVSLNTALDEIVGGVNGNETAIAGRALLSHTHGAGDVITGVLDPARLGTGTADSTKVLYGDGAWDDAPSGLLGQGAQLTAFTTPAWINVGDPATFDGGWKEDRNQHLAVTALDVGRTCNLTAVAFHVIDDQPTGTTHMGIWASAAGNLRPTGNPLWTGTASITTTSNKELDVSPDIALTPGVRLWIGLLNLGWAAGGELRRSVQPSSGAYIGTHYANDLNALYTVPTNGKFLHTLVRTGTTTISTDLTSATWVATGDRPSVAAKLEY